MNKSLSYFLFLALTLLFEVSFDSIPCLADGVDDKLSICITNKYGDVLTNLTVAKILDDGLVLESKATLLKVRYDDLPVAVREKYQPLASAAVAKEKQNREAEAAFTAGLQQGLADVAKAEAINAQRQKSDESKATGDLSVEIPGQSWAITILNPGLEVLDKQSNPDQFMYRAFARDNFEVSIFVETPAGNGTQNRDVFNYYWPKASRNPLIDPQTVRTEAKEKFVKVSYKSLVISNVNYYFAFKGRWIDVHISGNEKWFADFESHLSYGP